MCNNSDVNLVDGDWKYEGRVEVCYNGTWATVCGYYILKDNMATVVCKQLNHSLYGA